MSERKQTVKENVSKLNRYIRKGVNEVFKRRRNPSEGGADSVRKGTSLFEGGINPAKSVGMRLFLMFFVCIVALVLTVGLFSYNQSKKLIQDKVAEASAQTITQAGEKMMITLGNYEDITLQFIADATFMNSLSAFAQGSMEQYEALTTRREIDQRLGVVSNGKSGVTTAHLIPVKAKEMISPSANMVDPEKIRQLDWYKKVLDGKGKAVWLESQKEGFVNKASGETIGLGRLLTNGGDASYVLLLEISPQVLGDQLKQIKLGDSGQAVLVNDADVLVQIADATKVGTKYDIEISQSDKEKSLKSPQSTRATTGGQEQLVVYKKLEMSGWTMVASIPVSELVKDASKIWNVTLIIVLLSVIIAIIAGFAVARMIGTPLRDLRNLMQEGEKGNLTVRTDFKRRDEIGQVGSSFNRMMSEITALVERTNASAAEVLSTAGELLNASKQTTTAAKEIAVATEEIAGGASSLAVEAEKGNGLTQDIGVKVQQVVEANTEMGAAAADVQKASEQGTQYMSELSAKTASTEQMTRAMVEKVEKLKESTASIRKILDVLDNMTKQTNILSLNATIEAARAGAAGKGFMVVADEIRKLADQSKQNIAVVGSITEGIQKEIDETVAVLDDAYPLFREQIESVKEAETIFRQVQSHMTGFVGQLDDVSDSIQALDTTQRNLSEAMTNVSAVSEESSATSQEVASLSTEQLGISENLMKLAENLEQLSKSLQESLSKFEV